MENKGEMMKRLIIKATAAVSEGGRQLNTSSGELAILLWRQTIPRKAAGHKTTIAVQDRGLAAAENRLRCRDEEVVMLAEHAKMKQNVAVREGSHQFWPVLANLATSM